MTELQTVPDDNVESVYLGEALTRIHCFLMCSRFIGKDCELSIFEGEGECFSPESQGCVVSKDDIVKATGSSSWKNSASQNWAPSNAIDGETSSHIFHSNNEMMAWLQIEFAMELTITEVTVTNRKDKFSKNKTVAGLLADVFVRVGNDKAVKGKKVNGQYCGYLKGPSTHGKVHVIKCQKPRTGKYLTLQNKDTGKDRILQINEVEASKC